MQADRERLDQCAQMADVRIEGHRLCGADSDILREGARRGAHAQQVDSIAVRGLVGKAPTALPTCDQGQRRDVLAYPPCVADRASDGHDFSAELVAQHRTRREERVGLQV